MSSTLSQIPTHRPVSPPTHLDDDTTILKARIVELERDNAAREAERETMIVRFDAVVSNLKSDLTAERANVSTRMTVIADLQNQIIMVIFLTLSLTFYVVLTSPLDLCKI